MRDTLKYFEKHGLKPRPAQVEALQKLEQNWDRYRYHVLSASTGVGKSHIALAVAEAVGSSYLLTSTKQLQQQYRDTSPDLVTVYGRGNYQCGLSRGVKADVAPCCTIPKIAAKCLSQGICPYYRQVRKALQADTCLTNFHYFLYSAHCGPISKVDSIRKLTIVDEAHELENVLVSFAESTVDPAALEKEWGIKNLSWRFDNYEANNLKVLDDVRDAVNRKLMEYDAAMASVYVKNGVSPEDINAADKLPPKELDRIVALGKKKDDLDKQLGTPLNIYYSQRETNRWIVSGNEEKNTLTLTPLHAAGIFGQYMSRHSEKMLMLSATIGDVDVFCRELGISRSEVNYVEVDSDFPAENSPVVFCPVCKMGYSDIDRNMPQIVAAVAEIMRAHGTEKGIIHSANYKITEAIAKMLPADQRSRLIHRNMSNLQSISNQKMVEKHLQETRPTVLLSPSLGVGTDLADDSSRWQIIVKMPFPSLGDPRISVKSDLESDWYQNRTWLSIMQSSGRSTRHREDHSISYVLDGSVNFWYGKVKSKLPKWFTDRVHT